MLNCPFLAGWGAGVSVGVPSRSSTDWRRSTHATEGSLLYLCFTHWNVHLPYKHLLRHIHSRVGATYEGAVAAL